VIEDAADGLIRIRRLQARSNWQVIRVNRNVWISAKHNVQQTLRYTNIHTTVKFLNDSRSS